MLDDGCPNIPVLVDEVLAGAETDPVPDVEFVLDDEDAVLILKDPELEVLSPLLVGGIAGPGAWETPEGMIGPDGVTIPGMLSTVCTSAELVLKIGVIAGLAELDAAITPTTTSTTFLRDIVRMGRVLWRARC